MAAPRIAILASGGGGAVEAFVDASQDGRVDAEVAVVVCSRPPGDAAVYERVAACNARHGLSIPVVEISGRTHPGGAADRGQTDEESAAVAACVTEAGAEHVALMGYMRIVRGPLLQQFGWHPGDEAQRARMTNSHPGPLPQTADTYGLGAASRVLELGLPASAHTLHAVTAGVDAGPVLAAHPVEVYPGDTAESLFRRVVAVERVALPYALGRLLARRRAGS
jgi:phosphoribosylglycinamide formyltransferase 1